MHVIVHAGMEKTGSSALQEYLYRYRDELRDVGVIYPDLGHRSHWHFAAAIGGQRNGSHYIQRRMQRRNLADTEDAVLHTVRSAIIDAKENELVILSHESLGKPLQSAGLRKFLASCGVQCEQFSILAYIRNPIEHFPPGSTTRSQE